MAIDRLTANFAVILHADIVGSTTLVQRDERLAHERIQGSFGHLSKIIEKFRGRVRELRGDALLADFDRPSDAVAAALAFQISNVEFNTAIEDAIQPQVRIGISLGEVIVADKTVTGTGVVLAQRLEQLAAPGGVVVQGSVAETVPTRMPFEFEFLGEQDLKGFDKPVRAFSVSLQEGEILPAPEESSTLQSSDRGNLKVADKPSIAVLPFGNMSGDPEQEYFSDGITEDIIIELSRFSDLMVIARNSSFDYKGQSVQLEQIASELSVGYVMEGSVWRNHDRLRITTQLVEASSGDHIWAEKYDCDLSDIFDLQDEIARHVVGSIAPQVELAEMKRSRALGDTNLSAYELALKAQALTYDAVRVADPSMLEQALSLCSEALEIDNRCTHALWTRGMGSVFQYLYGWGNDPGSALTSAIEVADHLISIDPSNAKSFIVRAWAYQYRREYDLAIADYRCALNLNPNLALNLFTMAWSEAVAGLSAEAREHAQTALKLSPRDTNIWLGWAYAALELASFIEGDFSEAITWGQQAVQMHARMPFRQAVLVASYGHLGNDGAAESHIKTINTFTPNFLSAVLDGDIEVYKLPEHNAVVIEGLRKAGL